MSVVKLGLLVCLFAYSASSIYGEKLQWKCCHRTTYYCTTGYDCSKDAVFHQPQERCSGDHELHFVTQEECLAGSLCWYLCFHIFRSATCISALLRLLKMHLSHCCQTPSYSAGVARADPWEHRFSVWRQFSLHFVETGSSRNKCVIQPTCISRLNAIYLLSSLWLPLCYSAKYSSKYWNISRKCLSLHI